MDQRPFACSSWNQKLQKWLAQSLGRVHIHLLAQVSRRSRQLMVNEVRPFCDVQDGASFNLFCPLCLFDLHLTCLCCSAAFSPDFRPSELQLWNNLRNGTLWRSCTMTTLLLKISRLSSLATHACSQDLSGLWISQVRYSRALFAVMAAILETVFGPGHMTTLAMRASCIKSTIPVLTRHDRDVQLYSPPSLSCP